MAQPGERSPGSPNEGKQSMANDPSALIGQLQQLLGGNFDMSKLQGLIQPVMDLINQNGGLQGLLGKLQSGGLGEQVQSWISTGQNLAANPDQIAAALGPDQLKAAAEKAGTSAQDVATDLSNVLPDLVNKISPSGELPNLGNINDLVAKLPGGDQLSGLLGQLLGGGAAGGAAAGGAAPTA
jgi:uncharacterized protein YidB (DUF937 family)